MSSAVSSGGAPPRVDRYGMLFESTRDGVWVTGADGKILRANPALLELLGYAPGELLGRPERALFADPDAWEEVRSELASVGSLRDVELRLRRCDGTEAPCLLRLAAERDRSGSLRGTQGVVHDIASVVRAGGRGLRDRLHDSLTHLPNREAFAARVQRLLERSGFLPDYGFAVVYLDVDRFKRVNASLGHGAGDDLLVMVGDRLAELVRPEDVVARLGGDEYGILMAGVRDAGEAEAAAVRVQEGLERPFHLRGSEVCVAVSAGLVLADRAYREADDVIRDAHTAVHAAKAEAPGGRALFQGAMRERATAALDMEAALRRALDREELVLHYQPVVAISTGRLLGFEALLRWDHPERGLLAPSAFLPVAEDSGLIVPIGDWVLTQACRAAAGWRSEGAAGKAASGEDPPIVAVNLSVRQLALTGLAPRVAALLDRCGLPPTALWLEISEGSFLRRSDVVLRNLDALAALGVTLCLDDFGTVYSTLAWLQDLPVHSLKVDRAFVRQLDRAGGSEIIQTILSLARDLGMRAVAEGVETEAQRNGLLRLGCQDAQGFLFSEPLDPERAAALVAEGRVRRT